MNARRREVFVLALLSSLCLQPTGALEFIDSQLVGGKTHSVSDGEENVVLDFAYKLSTGEKLDQIKFRYQGQKDTDRTFYALKEKGKDVKVNINDPKVTASIANVNVTADDVSKAQFRLEKILFEKENNRTYFCEVLLENGISIEGKITIRVIKPPVFTHKAKDFESIREGLTLSLQCTASGEPKANIQWTRREHHNDSSEILKVSGSGLLEVANIKRNQAGNYTCSATNPAGTESHTTVVEVQYAAEIDKSLSTANETSYLNNPETVYLKCAAHGVPEPTYKWVHPNGLHISSDSLLAVVDPAKEDFGRYICKATNDVGPSPFFYVNLTQITNPDPPQLIQSDKKHARSVTIFITLPSNTGSSKIEEILFSYQLKNGTIKEDVQSGDKLTYTIPNLTPYSNYVVNATVKNKFLFSDVATVVVRTLEMEPGVPSNVNMAVESLNITVSWGVPKEPNGRIIQYKYKFFEADVESMQNATERSAQPSEFTRNFPGLKVYTRYSFSVRAATIKGNGPWSPVVTRYTDPRAPSMPANLTIYVNNYDSQVGSSLSVKWEAPLDTGGGEIKKYNILVQAKSKEFPDEKARMLNLTVLHEDAKGRFFTINSLLPYSSISVRLREGGGDKPIWGPYAGPKVVQMSQGAPEAPLTLEVIGKTDDKIHLRWLRPDRINGILTKFSISFTEKGKQNPTEKLLTRQLSNKTFFFTLDSLKPETAYQVKVYGHTVEARSPPSVPVEATTLVAIATTSPTVGGGDEDGSNTNIGAVVGGVISVLLVLCIGIILFLYISRKKKGLKRPVSQSSEAGFIKLDQTDKKDGVDVTNGSEHSLTYISNFTSEFNNKNERLFSMIRPIKLTSLKDYITKQHSNQDKGFIDEFRAIKAEGDFTFDESMKPENKKKNRYANILAYDHSRVVLNTVEDLDGSDYVNANYIDGYDKQAKFIATQGPVEAAFHDFWRMVWEQKTTTIVMVTNLVEKGRVKCQKYWPNDSDGEQVYGDIKVGNLDEMELADYVIRRFNITKLKNGEEIASRKIAQYQFTSWPDHGVPLFSSQLLQFVKHIRMLQCDGGPIILHCSAGVGRTGTYITLDSMLDQIEKENQIDVFGFVTHIRKQRNFLVQTEPQYIFIYNALLEHISCGNTEINTGDFPTKIKHLNTINPGTTQTYIQEEFGRLSTNIDTSRIQVDAASLLCNTVKNRFPDILPYEFTRVKLWPYPDVEGSDYINASFVDGYQQREAYILTQAPQQNTIQDFWRMLWEYEVFSIVMISSQDERDMHHCYPYWPINNEAASFGLLRVQITSEEERSGYMRREFRVSNTKNSESRVITHFMYFDWTADGAPDTSSLIEMIGQLQKTQQVTGNSSIVVHCSDGSGRSGTLIALMYCLERLKLEGVVDVFQTVRTMRTQRTKLVQTLEQYQFIYNAIRSFLDCFSDYANFK